MITDLKEFEITESIKQVIALSDDDHVQFTPIPICENVLADLFDLSGRILVVANLEFVYTLIKWGVPADRIYFATPCIQNKKPTAQSFGLAEDHILPYVITISKEIVWLNKDTYHMQFDVICGNPPYEKEIYKEFMKLAVRMTTPTGVVALITPTTFMSSVDSKGYRFRQELSSDMNIYRMEVLPTDVFTTVDGEGKPKRMILATVVTYLTHAEVNETTFTRRINDKHFTWTTPVCRDGSPINMFYDNVGRDIWNVCSTYPQRFNASKSQFDYRRQELAGPNVNIGVKLELQYLGGTLRIGNLFGNKVWTGKDVDVEGTYARIRAHSAKSTNTRLVFKTQHPINLGRYMDSKLFGILLTMTGTASDVSGSSVGKLPYVVLTGKYETDEEFLIALYDELGLTEDHIRWIKEFGTND